MKKRRRFYRRSIRWVDGKTLCSPRFPQTPEGKRAVDRWFHEREIQKKLILSGMELEYAPIRLDEFTKLEWMPARRTEVQDVTWMEDESKLLNRILPKFGSRELHTIRTAEIRRFLRELREGGLHPTTVDHYRALLSKLFNDAIRTEPPHMRINPVTPIRKMAKYDHRKKPSVWTEDQCRQYVAAARAFGIEVYVLAMFLVNTGLRQSELIAIRLMDLDLRLNQFTIRRVRERKTGRFKERTKSRQERTLGINALLRLAIQELIDARPGKEPSDLLLIRQDRRRGTAFTASAVDYWHKRIIARAELPYISPHALRHTFASLFAMKSGNLRALQGLLGHLSPAMIERYTHFLPGYLEQQAGVVEVGAPALETDAIEEEV